MRKEHDGSLGGYVHRHLSQLKILARLVDHELGAAKGQDITLDRDLVENLLDTVEIFIEDVSEPTEGRAKKERVSTAEGGGAKTVTRLN